MAQWAAVSTHLGYFEQIMVIKIMVEMMIKMVVKVVVKIEVETHSSEIRVPPQNHCSSTKSAAIQGKE